MAWMNKTTDYAEERIENLRQAIRDSDNYSGMGALLKDATILQRRREKRGRGPKRAWWRATRRTDRHSITAIKKCHIHPYVSTILKALIENDTLQAFQDELKALASQTTAFLNKKQRKEHAIKISKIHAAIKKDGYTLEQVRKFKKQTKLEILAERPNAPDLDKKRPHKQIINALFALTYHKDAQEYLGVRILNDDELAAAHTALKNGINAAFKAGEPPKKFRYVSFMRTGFDKMEDIRETAQDAGVDNPKKSIKEFSKARTNTAYPKALNKYGIPARKVA